MSRQKQDLSAYSDRVKRVVAHMHANLDAKMTVESLAEVACMSPFHWHRVYKKIQGETLSSSLRRLRLHRASYFLTQTDLKIREIAWLSGYVNHQSFGRAFQTAFGQSPSRFRIEQSSKARLSNQDHLLWPVELETLDPVAGYASLHEEDVVWIGKSLSWLSYTLKNSRLICDDPAYHRLFGLYERGRPSLAMIANGKAQTQPTNEPGVFQMCIGDTLYATVEYRGPQAGLEHVHFWFNKTWLPESKYERERGKIIEEYMDDPAQSASQITKTKIHWPVRLKAPSKASNH